MVIICLPQTKGGYILIYSDYHLTLLGNATYITSWLERIPLFRPDSSQKCNLNAIS
ncbi:hypothetical protein VDIAB_110065 [Vibrio diabolicus]|nr:hypothetical protein VDIAB_110065 [Vibrio diabolicus]